MHPGRKPEFFFSLTDGWTGGFFWAKQLDAQRGRSVCSRQHPGHPIIWQLNPLDRKRMFCGDFCKSWAFNSHVWSPFRGCGASERFSACGADFMNPKNQIHMQRCFGMAISMKAQWRGLWLEPFFLAFTLLLIVLAMQNSRGEAHAPKKLFTCHPRFPTHFAGHHVLISPD
jgi:hypothetical protein